MIEHVFKTVRLVVVGLGLVLNDPLCKGLLGAGDGQFETGRHGDQLVFLEFHKLGFRWNHHITPVSSLMAKGTPIIRFTPIIIARSLPGQAHEMVFISSSGSRASMR